MHSSEQRGHAVPSKAEIQRDLEQDRNWGRWGDDDQVGALNLITPAKRVFALTNVRSGRAVSLSRPMRIVPTGRADPSDSRHVKREHRWSVEGDEVLGGYAADNFGTFYHGHTVTHIDALCHVWDNDGMWNGRDPDEHITEDGATFGGIEHWSVGNVTRGILLDVPRFRGTDYVEEAVPVHGWELHAIVEDHGLSLEPGDALCVYSGP